jgi:hypothetical protein
MVHARRGCRGAPRIRGGRNADRSPSPLPQLASGPAHGHPPLPPECQLRTRRHEQLAGPELPLLSVAVVLRLVTEGCGLVIPLVTADAFDAVVGYLQSDIPTEEVAEQVQAGPALACTC